MKNDNAQITLGELIADLRKRVKEAGSQRALAASLGVSATYLGEILAGSREPGPKILDPLKLRRVVVYKRKE